jgi:Flp pilus assembly protein CpaB
MLGQTEWMSPERNIASMDIEFKYGQRKRRIVMVVGVVLAVVAFGGVLLTASAPPATAVVPTKQVLVAVADIKPRTVLAEGMFTVRTIADDPSLAQAYSDSTSLVGRTSAVQIYMQQPITPNLIANSAAGSAFSILEPGEVITATTPDWRAVSVMVPAERAVGGQLVAGQRVDLIATVLANVMDTTALTTANGAAPAAPATGGKETVGGTQLYSVVPVAEGATAPTGTTPDCRESPYGTAIGPDGVKYKFCAVSSWFHTGKTTKVSFQDVQVLAVTETTYILKVDLKTGEAISHLQADGMEFSLALRSDGDIRAVDTTKYGENTDKFLEENGNPVPEAYPRP